MPYLGKYCNFLPAYADFIYIQNIPIYLLAAFFIENISCYHNVVISSKMVKYFRVNFYLYYEREMK